MILLMNIIIEVLCLPCYCGLCGLCVCLYFVVICVCFTWGYLYMFVTWERYLYVSGKFFWDICATKYISYFSDSSADEEIDKWQIVKTNCQIGFLYKFVFWNKQISTLCNLMWRRRNHVSLFLSFFGKTEFVVYTTKNIFVGTWNFCWKIII